MSQVVNGLQKLFLYNGRFIRRASNSVSKELIQQSTGTTSSTDLLLTNLKNAKSVRNLFELVNSHSQIMNNRHSMQALRSLFTLQKNSRGDVSSQQVLNHPDFEKLCKQLKYQAGIIELGDTVEALKVLTYVGVSSDTLIFQTLLQLIRQSVNDLALQQIIFLDFLLKQVRSTPLVEALQIALPIVFEVQLPVKIDRYNIARLTEYLYYISRKNMSEKCTDMIVKAILVNDEDWDAKTTVSIVRSICDLKLNWQYTQILSKAFQSMLVHIDAISFEDLDFLVMKVVNRYFNKMPYYYNEELFDAIGHQTCNSDVGFEQAINMLRKFLKLNHIHIGLLDYVVTKCHQNPNLIISGDPVILFTVVSSVAMTDYRPKNWQSLRESILKIQNFDGYLKREFLHSFAIALSILNIYNEDILRECFDKRTLQMQFRKPSVNLLHLYQAIKTLKPELSYMLPDDSFMKQIGAHIHQVKEYPLEGCLHKILGGERYVKTNMQTKLHHQIDHIIVLRNGGYPVAINTNSDKIFLEDLEVTPENQIILVLGLGPVHYSLNSRRLKGTTCLTIQTLEAKGYLVVPICLELWTSLLEFERIPYIAEAIKLKSGYKEHLSDFMS